MIKLEPKDEARLKKALTEKIDLLKATGSAHHGLQISDTSIFRDLDGVLPPAVLARFKRYVGHNGMREFADVEIYSRLRVLNLKDTRGEYRLVELPGFGSAEEMADRIVINFKSLPWLYRLTIGLPFKFSEPLAKKITRIDLSPSLSMCRGDCLPEPFPIGTGDDKADEYLFANPSSRKQTERGITADRLYLTQTVAGWSGIYSGFPRMVRELEDSVAVLFGACMALDFIPASPWNGVEDVCLVIIHREASERPILRTESFTPTIIRSAGTFARTGRAEGAFENDTLDYLELVRQAFGKDALAGKMFLACIWYLRAYTADRSIDRLVYATIALEVALGDKDTSDKGGLSGLLGDRCAYMLSQTAAEREETRQSFKQIYRLRSKAVHEGLHHIDPEHVAITRKAMELGGRVIARELRLLKAGEDDCRVIEI